MSCSRPLLTCIEYYASLKKRVIGIFVLALSTELLEVLVLSTMPLTLFFHELDVFYQGFLYLFYQTISFEKQKILGVFSSKSKCLLKISLFLLMLCSYYLISFSSKQLLGTSKFDLLRILDFAAWYPEQKSLGVFYTRYKLSSSLQINNFSNKSTYNYILLSCSTKPFFTEWSFIGEDISSSPEK